MLAKIKILLLLIACFSAFGCVTRKVTTTERTAIEQLLISDAIDRAIEKISIPKELIGKRVYLNFDKLQGVDTDYIKSSIRLLFSLKGSILCEECESSESIIEVTSGCIGMEHKTSMFGLPAIPMPNSDTPFPEIPLFRSVHQNAIVKLLIFVHKDGKYEYDQKVYGKSERKENFVLFYRFCEIDTVRDSWNKTERKEQHNGKSERGQETEKEL